MLSIACPGCHRKHRVPDDYSGKQVKCKCGTTFRVESAEQAPQGQVASAVDLDNMDGFRFEELIIRLLRSMGLHVEGTRKTGDGGIDAIAKSNELITGGTYVVQCKRFSSNVGEPVVRDLYGVVHHTHASKGILITTADYTQQARTFAEGKPIELINGELLRLLLSKYKLWGDVPEKKMVYIMPPGLRRFFEGIGRIAAKLETHLERNRMIAPPTKRRYSLSQFIPLLQETCTDVSVSVQNLVRLIDELGDRLVKNPERFQEPDANIPYVDGRVSMLAEVVEHLIRRRDMVWTADVDQQCLALRDAVIGMIDAAVRQTLQFMKAGASQVELDGKVVDKGTSINLWFRPNVDAESKAVLSELAALNAMRS